MSESLPANTSENITPEIKFLEKNETTLTEQDVQDFRNFISNEMIAAQKFALSQPPESNEASMRLSDVGVHAMAHKDLSLQKKLNNPFRLLLAKNDKGQIVGYSFFSFARKDEVGSTLIEDKIGVGHDWRRKGIGTELLTQEIQVLRNLGIQSYITEAREEVVNIYGKIEKATGIKIEVIKPLSSAQMAGQRLRIKLGS